MSVLEVSRVTKHYPGAQHNAIDDVSLRVDEGEILALVGESGSGKTTLLRLIAGLEIPTSGVVEIGGQTVCAAGIWLPPERRGVSLVFQDYALFPHLSVASNVAYGLARWPRKQRRERTDEILAMVGLEQLGDRYPHALSGGQQQRVALARALAPQPTVLLLDEPFSNLDAALKARLRDDLGDLIRRAGTTAILVVHDSDDALALGDRIAIMREGAVCQLGTPQMVYASPRDGYVARFFGETNLLPARRGALGYETPLGFHPTPHTNGNSTAVTIALYPQELELRELAGEGVPATVIRSIFRGSHQQLTVRVNGSAEEEPVDLQVHLDGCWPLRAGSTVHVRIRPEAAVRVLTEAQPLSGHCR